LKLRLTGTSEAVVSGVYDRYGGLFCFGGEHRKQLKT